MKKSNLFVSLIALLAGVAVGLAGDKDTKYAAEDGAPSVASATVLFGPGAGKTVVSHLEAACDKDGGAVKFYSGGTFKTVTAVEASGVTCSVALASSTFTTSDKVVYVYNNGTTPEYRTVSGSPTTTTLNLSSALTGIAQVSAKDRLYLVTQGGQILVGKYGTGIGTNDTVSCSGDVYATPSGSPLYVVLDGTSNAVLQVTVDK